MVLVVVMGVSGSGKTTVGSRLAAKFGWKFYDADDYHSPENKKKMAEGIPLNDEITKFKSVPENLNFDPKHCVYVPRYKEKETIQAVHLNCIMEAREKLTVIQREDSRSQDAVLACSALKKMYRLVLVSGASAIESNQTAQPGEKPALKILFVHLHGPINIIAGRLEKRRGHFMPPELLKSQFDILEPPRAPENFITVSLEKSLPEILLEIESAILQDEALLE